MLCVGFGVSAQCTNFNAVSVNRTQVKYPTAKSAIILRRENKFIRHEGQHHENGEHKFTEQRDEQRSECERVSSVYVKAIVIVVVDRKSHVCNYWAGNRSKRQNKHVNTMQEFYPCDLTTWTHRMMWMGDDSLFRPNSMQCDPFTLPMPWWWLKGKPGFRQYSVENALPLTIVCKKHAHIHKHSPFSWCTLTNTMRPLMWICNMCEMDIEHALALCSQTM